MPPQGAASRAPPSRALTERAPTREGDEPALAAQAEIARLQELLREYSAVRTELNTVRARIAELREAKRILEEKKPRTVFREVGGLLVETSLEEALRYVSDELEVLELRQKKLEEQEKRLLEAIRQLEEKLGLR